MPGGPAVKEPPSNAGDMGLTPGRGTKIPYAAGQPNLCATTTEPLHPWSPHTMTRKQSMNCDKDSACRNLRPKIKQIL